MPRGDTIGKPVSRRVHFPAPEVVHYAVAFVDTWAQTKCGIEVPVQCVYARTKDPSKVTCVKCVAELAGENGETTSTITTQA